MTYDEIMSGGVWANGTASLFADYFPSIASAGFWANGAGLILDDEIIVGSGGVWANGSAILLVVHRPSITSAGLWANGSAIRTASSHCLCAACCEPDFEPSGGAYAGGTALVDDTTIVPAGVLVAGSALVDVPTQVFDHFAGFYLLNEVGHGTAGEYKDRSAFALNGTGGNGIAANTPAEATGVFCRGCQVLSGKQFIQLPRDHVGVSQALTVSCWVNIEDDLKSRTIYSRGQSATIIEFGYTYVRNLYASVTGASGTVYSLAGPTRLTQGVWYHVALVVSPQQTIALYVDGVLDNSTSFPEKATATQTDGEYIGRKGTASYPTADIQDLRIIPEARSQAWLLAEFRNLCDPGFVLTG